MTPTIASIQRAVCERYGLTMRDLLGSSRERRVAWPRQEAMRLCREMTRHSFPEIGRRFGGRDHATVIHGIRAARLREWERLAWAEGPVC